MKAVIPAAAELGDRAPSDASVVTIASSGLGVPAGPVMIGNVDVTTMAAELVRAYGIEAAASRATKRTLAELDDGNLSMARAWRQVLNAVHRLAALDPNEGKMQPSQRHA